MQLIEYKQTASPVINWTLVLLGSLQNESNGRLSNLEKHAAKVDVVEARNTTVFVQELVNNHTT